MKQFAEIPEGGEYYRFIIDAKSINVLTLAGLIVVLVALIHLNPTVAAGMLAIGCFAWAAWYFPVFTLVITITLGQIVQHELAPIIGIGTDGFRLGGINIRLSDPLLAGIAVATGLRFLRRNEFGLSIGGIAWTLLLAYLAFQILRNLGAFGINSVGEFRTYWHFLVLLPYAAISADSPDRRLSILKILIVLSLSNLLWAILRGGILHGFGFSAYDKWLSSVGSLSLVFGAFAFLLLRKTGAIVAGTWKAGLLIALISAVVVVAGSRSVWLVSVLGAILVARSAFPIRNRGFTPLVLILSLGLLIIPFSISGIDPIRFLTERLLALTDFQQDPTSAWRYYFWVSTIENIMNQPWLGSGFGPHFDIFVPELNEVFTTSPHNLYLTVLSQAGILGLVLYLLWVISLGRILIHPRTFNPIDRTIARIGFISLVGIHLYAIAFSFEKDFTSWVLIGVGVAACINPGRQKNEEEFLEHPG